LMDQDHTYVSNQLKYNNISPKYLEEQEQEVMRRNSKSSVSKRKHRSRSPSPLTDLPLEVQLETEDENGKLVPMLQIRNDIIDECPNTCELCGRAFPNSTGLRTHERSHNGPVQNQPKPKLSTFRLTPSILPTFTIPALPPFNPVKDEEEESSGPCLFENLRGTDKWPYKCGQCSQTCSSSSNLRQHLLRKHEPLFQNPTRSTSSDQSSTESKFWKDGMFYVCTYCGKSFLHIVGFRSHWRRHIREGHAGLFDSATELVD